jgi:hypothetical protein
MACATKPDGVNREGWKDVTAMIRNLHAGGLVPVMKRNISAIVPDSTGSFAIVPQSIGADVVEDLRWTSQDGRCAVIFGAVEPDATSYADVLIRCDAPTRRHAEDMLLSWLDELDHAYADRLRRALPAISGVPADEFVAGNAGRQTRVQFDIRHFKEGWAARIDLH